MTDPASDHPPTPEQRRAAACLAMSKAPGLIRFAARYTRSLHDAEDAYQRAMEIALSGAPVTEPRRFMAWLHTVLRHEALAVARARRREGPNGDADLAETHAERVPDGLAVDAVAEWRHRYRVIQDGLAGLTDAQRICLILQSSGASYERIRQLTGYTLRKVERSVVEGRASLHAWEIRLTSGEICDRLLPEIERVATGAATARERRAVGRHVRHCGPCRTVLRSRRESNEWLAALVPVAFLASETLSSRAPDPSPVLAWWERLAGGATVKAGNAIQMAMELPSGALAKVGAGTAAVAVATAAGAPIVADAVRHEAKPPPVAAAHSTATRATTAAKAPAGAPAPRKRASFPTARRRAASAATSRQVAAAVRRPSRATLPARPDPTPASVEVKAAPPASPPTPPAPAPAAPARAPAPAPAPTRTALAMEFGP